MNNDYFSNMIRTVGMALAFSPNAAPLLQEAAALAARFSARLVVLHVGQKTAEEEKILEGWLQSLSLNRAMITCRWMAGDTASVIRQMCKEEKVDLLVAGALKKENLIQYYLGSVARKIMRKAGCSVLVLVNPSTEPKGFSNIVVNADDHPATEQSLMMAMHMTRRDTLSWLHLVRELKMYGLAMSASDQHSETEYEGIREDLVRDEIEKVEKMVRYVPHNHIKVNIKVISGKSGFEIGQFAARKKADLLVVPAPDRSLGILDRIYPHDTEYILADLPCNVLLVKNPEA